MITIPAQLHRRYVDFIARKGVAPPKQQYYVRWLRFYVDFCHKYNFPQGTGKSLSAFMDKLKEKRQSEQFREQAARAVSMYFDLVSQSTKINTSENSGPREQKSAEVQRFPTRKRLFKQENNGMDVVVCRTRKLGTFSKEKHKKSGNDWTAVYKGLEDAIKIRHYSPRNLENICGLDP